jgi:3-oxoacyl-[acyl-carrier-protein] synthase III
MFLQFFYKEEAGKIVLKLLINPISIIGNQVKKLRHTFFKTRPCRFLNFSQAAYSLRENQILEIVLAQESVLEILAHGAWNGGTVADNSIYEGRGMFFKGNIPVDKKSIEERIGIRTRVVAPDDVRIGTIALENLLQTSGIDPGRVKFIIGATNVGDDKREKGPLVRHPFEIIKKQCPDAIPFDLYAGCPGYNVSVELLLMLSLAGVLKEGDVSIIVGAENIHRAKAFVPMDTSNIIFGDDSLATALETKTSQNPPAHDILKKTTGCDLKEDFISHLAEKIFQLNGHAKIDGIIIDNHLGSLIYRVPASAARVQHRLVELMNPEEKQAGRLNGFKDLLEFYNKNVDSFAYDIMTLTKDPRLVEMLAKAYIQSGKYRSIVTVFLTENFEAEIAVHQGNGFSFNRPKFGVVDTYTKTHGCFADFIQAVPINDDIFGDMNGKGVFLYATRGAKPHLSYLFSQNNLTVHDIELLIEHQANFAMIPMTIEKVLEDGQPDLKKDVLDYVANKMITNIHTRGNCSVVCMQRLPYDLDRGALKPDTINGFPVNQNLEKLKQAKIIINDSVGAGMMRSSFLQIKK